MKTPDHRHPRPNVPFNSSSAFVFSFFRPNPPPLAAAPSRPPVYPLPTFSLFFIRCVSVRERSAAAGHRKYISVEKVKRPPYVRHHSGWADGRASAGVARLLAPKKKRGESNREEKRRGGMEQELSFLVHVYFSRDYKRS